MRIERVELWHVRIPLRVPFYPSWIPGYPQRENRFDLIRIFTSDGVVGVSSAPSFGREREGLGSVLGPFLVGQDPQNFSYLKQRLLELSYLGQRQFWIEPAFWDLKGKMEGKPVYSLFGAEGGEVAIYGSLGTAGDPSAVIEKVRVLREEGFSVVKLRVKGEQLDEDLKVVREVVKHFPDLTFGVDANQGWPVDIVKRTPRWSFFRALNFAKACEDLGVSWLEEPLFMEDHYGLSSLRREVSIPIAGGELQTGGVEEIKRMILEGCYDIYQPDAVLVGGIGGSLTVMHYALGAGYRFTPHTWTNGIGFLINLQLFAIHPQREKEFLEFPYDPPGWVPEVRDGVLASPVLARGGKVSLPKTPGLGVEIDEKSLKRWGTCFYRGTLMRVFLQSVRDRGVRQTLELYRLREKEKKTSFEGSPP
jgi:L-alanine-DL-glutamate epimerase-like enolase superfamily enzyme